MALEVRANGGGGVDAVGKKEVLRPSWTFLSGG